ncbi:YopX family protein [Bacillus subtilis]|uniref:YopX family protein n=1 Tax=Bacillus subtilis TaxID=1423 RepID=UPI002DC02432|nr:YopX family protein [Bacillus subtilis]MEC1878356.1 YopX family protein [Bacillus subtilis]MEC1936649.1 YopX family protein [Bacillus subtilis]
MREIKFRAWNKENSIMVYEDEDNSSAYWDGVCLSDIEMINARLKYSSTYIWMQYTGLKDKNGREIYEGDIVIDGHKNSAEVVFDDGCFCVIGYLGDLRTHPLRDSLFCGERFEVIGNIYEDPQLLEAAE